MKRIWPVGFIFDTPGLNKLSLLKETANTVANGKDDFCDAIYGLLEIILMLTN